MAFGTATQAFSLPSHYRRKRVAQAAAYGEAGTLLAVARATWIAVDRQVQLGRA
jgi:hypothetical protein